MNEIECETCIKRKTKYCPNSSECYETKEKPYYQNRIMLLEENQQLKNQLKEKLEASEKARKESMLILGEYKHYTLPTEEQNRENEDIVDKAYNNLILKQDIDKGEWK